MKEYFLPQPEILAYPACPFLSLQLQQPSASLDILPVIIWFIGLQDHYFKVKLTCSACIEAALLFAISPPPPAP